MGLFSKKPEPVQLPPHLQAQLAGGPLASAAPKSSFVDRFLGQRTNTVQAQQDQLYQAQLNNQQMMIQNAQQAQMGRGVTAFQPQQQMMQQQYFAHRPGTVSQQHQHVHTHAAPHTHVQQVTHVPPHHHDVHLAHQVHHGHVNAHDIGTLPTHAHAHASHAHVTHHDHVDPHGHVTHHDAVVVHETPVVHAHNHAEIIHRPAVIDVSQPHIHDVRTATHDIAQQDAKTCVACGRAIEGYYADYYGSYYHSDCLERTRERRLAEAAPASGAPKRTCAWSGKPITGFYVEFYGHAYLPECFEAAKPTDGNWPVDAIPHATEEVISVPSEVVHEHRVVHTQPVAHHHHVQAPVHHHHHHHH